MKNENEKYREHGEKEEMIFNKYNPVSDQDNTDDSRFTLPDYQVDGLSDHEPMYQPEDPGEDGGYEGKKPLFFHVLIFMY